MKAKIIRVGDAYALELPEELRAAMGAAEGDEVEIVADALALSDMDERKRLALEIMERRKAALRVLAQ